LGRSSRWCTGARCFPKSGRELQMVYSRSISSFVCENSESQKGLL
jgi:hypothetical protein